MVQKVIKQKTQFRNNPVGLTKFNSVDAGKSQAIINLAGQAKQIIEEVRIPQRQQEAKQDAAALTVEDLLNTDEEGNPTVVNTDHLRGKGSVYTTAFKENVLSNQYDEIESKISSRLSELAAANKFTPNGVADFEKQGTDFLLELSQKLKGNLEVFAGNAGRQKLLETSAALQNSRAARTYQQTHEKSYNGLLNSLNVLASRSRLGQDGFESSSDSKIIESFEAENGILDRLSRTKGGPFEREAQLAVDKFKATLGINGLKKLTNTLEPSEQQLVLKFLNNQDGITLKDLRFIPSKLHSDLESFMKVDSVPFRNQLYNDIKETYSRANVQNQKDLAEEETAFEIEKKGLVDTTRSNSYPSTAGDSYDDSIESYMFEFERNLNSNSTYKNLSEIEKQNILNLEKLRAPTLLASRSITEIMVNPEIPREQKKVLSDW